MSTRAKPATGSEQFTSSEPATGGKPATSGEATTSGIAWPTPVQCLGMNAMLVDPEENVVVTICD